MTVGGSKIQLMDLVKFKNVNERHLEVASMVSFGLLRRKELVFSLWRCWDIKG